MLVTLPTDMRESFFTEDLYDRLDALGEVAYNETAEQFAPDELRERLRGVEACVTGWGTPQLDADALADADDLELLAHTGGSVADYASGTLYDRGVAVCSANRVMARFVAELTLGHAVGALRDVTRSNDEIAAGEWPEGDRVGTLFGSSVGLVGLGTVGRHLLPLLAPFDVDVSVYDPYVSPADLAEYGFVEKATLPAAMDSAVVSIHAARTPETVGMVGAEELAAMPDGALLVNTARAEIVERDALLAELRSGRVDAALDVFHEEPLPADAELRSLPNVTCTPHTGGSRIRPPLTEAMVAEVERHADGRALQHEIPRGQFSRMTR